MKFTRRHDLDPQTRIDIVKDVWINQGIYGKMTQIAQAYHISRTFLYQLSWAASYHLENLFSDPQHLVQPPDDLLEPWILALRLEGNCTIPSISSIFKQSRSETRLRLSAGLRGVSQRIPPRLWALCSFNPTDGPEKSCVLSQ